MAICVPNSEASHVMSGLEKRIEICSVRGWEVECIFEYMYVLLRYAKYTFSITVS